MKRTTAIVFTLLLAACSKGQSESGTAAGATPKKSPRLEAPRVEVAVLRTEKETDRFVRPGEVEGAREAKLASSLGGFVERVFVSSGETVRRGAIIARIDTNTHNAQSQLTKVEHDEAEREFRRLESLGKAVASSRVDVARARLDRAKAQFQLAKTRVDRATIRAPFAGVLVNLKLETGEVIAPGAPIGRLLQIDPVVVSVSVTDRDISAVKKGMAAHVLAAGSPNPLAGEVARIEPAADPRTRTFLVEVKLANPQRALLPGMIATVEFRRESTKDRLLIPQDLIVTRLDGNGVFVVDDEKRAKWRPVELGEVLGTQVEVVSGLSEGATVVVLGHRTLADGDALIVTREGVCCTNGRPVFRGKEVLAKPEEKTPKTEAVR